MKITREADYALRIVAMLAENGRQIGAKEISDTNNVPYRFTLKILRKISAAGYLKSHRGANGGYELNKPAGEITLKNIIEVIDGDIIINRCNADEPCTNNSECRIKSHMTRIQRIIADELDKITFADLTESAE